MEHQHTAGMDESHGGHKAMGHGAGGHMMHMGNLKRKFFICLALAIPVLLFSPMMGLELPFQLSFPGSQWVVLALATGLYFYGGMPFLQGAWQELKDKSPAMMTLISLGITVAYFYSLYAFINNHFLNSGHHVMDFFWELATLIVIMLLGHWIEMKAVAGAGDTLQKMAELLPGEAALLEEDGTVKPLSLRELQVGQRVLVRAGEKVPADGVIEKGSTSVNEAMVTGEARAVAKETGDKVIGGSVNGAGSIEVKVTGTGESGYLAQVMQLVGSAQQEKSRAEGLSDKVAKWLFYVALAAGILAFIIWLVITKSIDMALARMVTVLIIACPHALGLAIPLVVARSTSLGAKNGLLVRNRQALETAKKVDVIMMDKTGTLTEGRFTLKKVRAAKGMEENGVLAIMAALEQNSTHPLAAGIVEEAQERNIAQPVIHDVQNLPGIGLEGYLANGARALIASPAYLDKHQIAYDKAAFEEQAGQGDTISFLLLDDRVAGWVAQGDTIKPQAAQMIRALKAQGIRPVMLTGDNPASAKGVAQTLGMDEFEAGLLPQDKEQLVREVKHKGDVVMMVGDGVNDAPSLARADIGVAIGAGTDVAIDSADVVLVKSDPADILHFLALAKNTNRKMVQNLWWGAGYNIVAIPLAAGVLAPVGILLSPAVGAVLMSLSTVIVAINALTLRIK